MSPFWKRTLCGLMATILAAVAAASPFGMARSQSVYTVTRAASNLGAGGDQPFLVATGDQIASGEGLVRIDGTKGQTILLDEQSTAELSAADSLRLMTGNLVLALPAKENYAVDIHDLKIMSLPLKDEAEGEQSGALGIGVVSENEVEVIAHGRMFAVNTLPDNKQIAVLGAADSMKFLRNPLGEWIPMGPVSQFEGDPTEEETHRERKGIWAFFRRTFGSTTGAAAAGGTAAAIILLAVFWDEVTEAVGLSEDDEEDDDAVGRDSNFRRPSTPTSPVDHNPPIFEN